MSVRVEALREAASALEQERESIMEMIQAIQTGQEMRNICPGEAAPRPRPRHGSDTVPQTWCMTKTDTGSLILTDFQPRILIQIGCFISVITDLCLLLSRGEGGAGVDR